MIPLGKKITFPIFLFIFFIAASQFIAPLTIEPGTVEHLGANANMLDYSNKWDELPIFHRIIYYFGDFNCHQLEERSLYVNGNQMPMCARCTGIFVGLALGVGLALAAPVKGSASETILNLFPRTVSHPIIKVDSRLMRRWNVDFIFSPILAGISFLLALPMAIDGLGQTVLGLWESTNTIRLVTGGLFGFISFFWFTTYVHSVLYVPEHEPNVSVTQGGGQI